MDFLTQQNKRVAGDDEARAAPKGTLTAKGKHVVVIGGGDTGSDCVGTSNRQGAASVTQLEIMPQPPEQREQGADLARLAAEDAHLVVARGRRRPRLRRADQARRRRGRQGHRLECVRIDWVKGADGRMAMKEVAGSEFDLQADLVLLAMGFLGPRKPGMVEQSGVDARSARQRRGQHPGLQDQRAQAVRRGDMRRGQSLVVWAIREGRQCARVDRREPDGPTTLPR